MSDNGLRKPNDAEQAVIAAVYAMRTKLDVKRIEVAAVGMGPERIEDENGRWTSLFGLPVVEVSGPDRHVLVLLVKVEP